MTGRPLSAVIVVVVAISAVGAVTASHAAPPSLSVRERGALYDLYAADTALARARSEAQLADARVAKVQATIVDLGRGIVVARANVTNVRRRLLSHLVALYRTEPVDPIDVLLSATTLGEAFDGIDLLNRSARVDARLARETRDAREGLAREAASLVAARATVAAQADAAAARVRELDAAVQAKRGLVRRLRARQIEIARLDARAQAAATRSSSVTEPPSHGGASAATAPPTSTDTARAQPPSVPPVTTAGATLSVSATAYNLTGTTASGLPTGPGICATDPRVIPLGTRFSVPGYGTCLAADTGSAVIGATVDVWLPGEEAVAWGRKTVTITIQ